jgi:hypothetical protein
MSTRRRPTWERRRGLTAVLAIALAGGGSLAPRQSASAVDYNDTNPGATPCGDGSNPVTTLRNFFVKSGGLAYARVELRWSPLCNTVWARAVNVTGTTGAGYAPARSLTASERIIVYNCPRVACVIRDQTETGDVLPGNGNSGWSHQFVIVPNGTLNNPPAKQPPTLRALFTIKNGAATYAFDTNFEPVWTWHANEFKNERNLRISGKVLSCDNAVWRCTWHGEPGGISATVLYELDASLATHGGSADLLADLKDVILPAWSQRTTRSPKLQWCNSGCANEDVLVKLVPPGDPQLFGNLATTIADGYSAGTPALFLHQTLRIMKTPFEHECGLTDNGCGGFPHNDDRPLISHEIGHTLGLGHCDIDFQVMCHVISTTSTELYFEGTSYWKPQTFDVRALQAFYP